MAAALGLRSARASLMLGRYATKQAPNLSKLGENSEIVRHHGHCWCGDARVYDVRVCAGSSQCCCSSPHSPSHSPRNSQTCMATPLDLCVEHMAPDDLGFSYFMQRGQTGERQAGHCHRPYRAPQADVGPQPGCHPLQGGLISLPTARTAIYAIWPLSKPDKARLQQEQKCGGFPDPMGTRVCVVEAAGRERVRSHMAQFFFPS